jgi:hypothetical protein
MECQVCYIEVRGDWRECEIPLTLDLTIPYQEPTTNLNWMECDACGQIVCFNCCRHPASKLCDPCLGKHKLVADLIALSLLEENYYEGIVLQSG